MGTGVKVVVPEGMMKAADEAWDHFGGIGVDNRIRVSLEAALIWLMEDWKKSPNTARMPDPWYSASLAKWEKFRSQWNRDGDISFVDLLNFFGNRMIEHFLAPEPEVPKELESLLYPTPSGIPVVMTPSCVTVQKDVNDRIIEAFRRGQKAGK